MEDELNYLSEMIEEKEREIDMFKRISRNSHWVCDKLQFKAKIKPAEAEKQLLENILSVITASELKIT